MRRSWTTLVLAVILSICGLQLAHAEGWFKKHWNSWMRDAQRNNAWPEAFIPGDRAAVRAPFNQMVANGWRTQNTLSDYHFAEDSGQLNEAGRLKVHDVLTEPQSEYRTIFVLRTLDPQETAARIASVYEAANRILPPGATASVAQTDIEPSTTPSSYVDAVDRSYKATQPVPRLDSSSGGGSSGGGLSGAPSSGS